MSSRRVVDPHTKQDVDLKEVISNEVKELVQGGVSSYNTTILLVDSGHQDIGNFMMSMVVGFIHPNEIKTTAAIFKDQSVVDIQTLPEQSHRDYYNGMIKEIQDIAHETFLEVRK